MLRYKYLYLPLLFIFLFYSLSIADDGVWYKVSNPYKIGTVEEIGIGYTDEDPAIQYIFAATSSEPGKLWRTTDSGIEWEENHYVEDYYHTRVVVQKDDFWRGWSLMIGTTEQSQAGPYYTTDKGAEWSHRAAGLPHPENLHALAVVQNEYFTTAIVGGSGTGNTGDERIFKWNVFASEWQAPEDDGLPVNEDGTVHDIDICESQPNVMFCAYSTETGDPANNGIYRSTNGGDSWTLIHFNSTASAMAVAVHPKASNIIVVVEEAPQRGRIWMLKNGQWHDITMYDVYYYPLKNTENAKLIHWEKVLELNLDPVSSSQ